MKQFPLPALERKKKKIPNKFYLSSVLQASSCLLPSLLPFSPRKCPSFTTTTPGCLWGFGKASQGAHRSQLCLSPHSVSCNANKSLPSCPLVTAVGALLAPQRGPGASFSVIKPSCHTLGSFSEAAAAQLRGFPVLPRAPGAARGAILPWPGQISVHWAKWSRGD